MAKMKPKKTLKRPAASAPKKKASTAKKVVQGKKTTKAAASVSSKKGGPSKKGAPATKAAPAKKAVVAKKAAPVKAAPPPVAKPTESRRPVPFAPVAAPPPPSLAPLRVPDIVIPDAQEIYDESINEFEADASRESETDRQPDEEPGTSTQRQAEHPAPESHHGGKRPRGIPVKKPQDA